MIVKKLIAVCAATVAVIILSSAVALAAAGTTVTVRIEGVNKNLLAATHIRTHGGWITKGGTPSRTCPETSAAGALDAATHHKWDGTYSASVGGLEILSILGERHTFTSPFYWDVFINNKPLSVGACLQTLHRGDQLLFAAVSQKVFPVYPTAIRAPRNVTAGHAFTAKVVWFNAKGIAKPLAGARVKAGAVTMTTTSRGTVQITPARRGSLVIRADEKDYIRAAAARVKVSG